MTTLLLADDAMQRHDTGAGHPERPQRLEAIAARLHRDEIAGARMEAPPVATRDVLERVHPAAYVDRVFALDGQHGALDPDTRISPGSVHAARLAAGAAVRAVDAVVTGEATNAFALVRPPGHHAEPATAMGFCMFNNVAIAAEHARAVHGIERVLVVDWDVHHGNGTQDAFASRDDVLFFSTHQWPLYPGTGAAHEIGRGAGQGFTINVPIGAGAGDGDYVAIFRELLVPVADELAPQLVLVSAGFDAHRDDPLGGMAVTEEGFAELCAVVDAIARRHAGGRLVLVLEGGYDLDGLASSVHACARVMAGASAPGVPSRPGRLGDAALRRTAEHHRARWRV